MRQEVLGLSLFASLTVLPVLTLFYPTRQLVGSTWGGRVVRAPCMDQKDRIICCSCWDELYGSHRAWTDFRLDAGQLEKVRFLEL